MLGLKLMLDGLCMGNSACLCLTVRNSGIFMPMLNQHTPQILKELLDLRRLIR